MSEILELRDYQDSGIEMLRQGFIAGHRSQLLCIPTGGGKCLGYDTPVLMADGRVLPVQDIVVGDIVMGPDGTGRRVESLARGRERLCEIHQTHGYEKFIVNASHIVSTINVGFEVVNIKVSELKRNMLYRGWRVPNILSGDHSKEVNLFYVRDIGEGDYYGFTLSGQDRLFLLGDFTVTHNTECAISLMNATSKNYKRASMILDRVVLCDQTSKRLDRYNIPHGVMQANHWRYRPYERIQVCSAQTLESRGISPDTDLLIVDECHNTRRGTIELIKNNPRIRVIGLTATPFTKGLGEIYTNVVNPITMNDLVQQGSLVPLRVFIATEADMAGAKKVAGEWTADDVTRAGNKIVGDVVSEWAKVTMQVFARPAKTIVFAGSVEHATTLSDRFREAGFNFIPLTYMDDGGYKRDIVEEFSRPDTAIHGLIAVDILTKGFDVPDVLIGISARPFSKSFSSHVQQIGRVVRKAQGKEFGVWIDHSGNFLRFQEQYEQLYFDGVRSLGDEKLKDKPVREKTEKEKNEAKCPKCGALRTGKICFHCGFEFPNRSTVEEVSGTVSEIDVSSNEAERAKRNAFYRELLAYCEKKGYKPEWAYHKFKDKYGINPPRGESPASEISEETARWIKYINIRNAKSKWRRK